ncbi:MAG: Dolichyl-phosphate-mannose-protein mannosyltransferase [Chloroflexi bacterium OLB14]|nr:MAG: Dolichyl-phosphate-mannose-protein mannosyltransferase [Chloroflexi bacterium OLB14]
MTRSNFFASFLTLSLLSAIGIFLTLYATPQGLGLSDDSIAYIAGARSILNGDGYREAWLASNQPVTHFPPAFSSVLALVGITGLDPLRGTRFVNSILFGANIFLLGIIGSRMTKSQVAGVALAILFLVNYSLFRVHSTAMSEPLYIFFTLASFLTFYFYFQLKQKRWLIITGCLVGLAYLTRYAGLALFATFFVSLILLRNNWKDRLSRSALFVVSFIPFALGWSMRNQLVADNATNRTLVYHPITSENIQMGVYNVSLFLMPIEAWRKVLIKIPNLFNLIIFIILFALLAWILIKGLKKFFQPSTEKPEILSFISVLYIFGYLASIISSMTLFDASTKFQLRILAPIFVSVLIVSVYFLEKLYHKQKHLSSFFFLVILSLSLYGTINTITDLRKGGQGYASFQWFDAEAMEVLRHLPEGTRIYTNEAAAVYLYTQRGAYVLPDLVDPVTGQERGGFEQGVANLQADVLSGKAVLALFDVGKDEQTQALYKTLSDNLYLAFDKQNDTIYTAYP